MIITSDELKGNAWRVIRFLDNSRIESIDDLRRFSGRRYQMKDKKPDYIEVTDRSLIDSTRARVISYVSPLIQGIPIEGRFNLDKNKSMIIVKADGLIEDYSPLVPDRLGNLAQYKERFDVSFQWFRRELESLFTLSPAS